MVSASGLINFRFGHVYGYVINIAVDCYFFVGEIRNFSFRVRFIFHVYH